MQVESQTVLQLGVLWISTNFIKFLIGTGIVIFIIKWLIGGTKNLFAFYDKWIERGLNKREQEVELDENVWSKDIDRRVAMLNKIKSTETSIRHELDKLHEVKVAKEDNKK